MTKKEYFEAVENFDWYFQMSDDSRAYNAGCQREKELIQIGRENGWLHIWQAWKDYMFSGEPWGTEKKPKPLFFN